LLTVAPVEAFGFLTDSSASITLQDSNLSVNEGKTLSLIGGDLELNGNSSVIFDEGHYKAITANSKLTAEAGHINLVGINSGEFTNQNFELNGKGGKIILNNTLIESSSEQGGGKILIVGEQLIMQNSTIQTNTLADIDGKDIDIKLSKSVNINGDIQAVISKNFASAKGGNINITTPNLTISGGVIDLSSFAEGSGGNVEIKAEKTELNSGGSIESNSFGIGKSGNISIDSDKFLSLLGQRKGTIIGNNIKYIDFPSKIATNAYVGNGGDLFVKTSDLNIVAGSISAPTFGTGNAGSLIINTDNFSLDEGAFIASSSAGTGDSGTINLTVTDTLSLFGRRKKSYFLPTGMEVKNNQSAIVTFALLGGNGGDIFVSANKINIYDEGIITSSTVGIAEHSGNINIKSENLHLFKGGQINNSNGFLFGRMFLSGPANSGSINIESENIDIVGNNLLTGIYSDSYTSGQGGNITVKTNNLNINNSGSISASSASTGNAGQINIQANNIHLTNQGNISTKAENATGGNVLISTPNLLYLQKGEIITSVHGGTGDGGSINISHPTFVVLNQSKIIAQAFEGNGGNIQIKSERFISSPNSLISASSRLGLDGEVNIDSPDMDMTGFLVILSDDYVDVSSLIQKPCRMRDSSFTVQKINGSPQTPYDYQPSAYLPENNGEVTKISMNLEEKIALSTCKK
ncbi:MAG: hypothetical protein KAG43_09485, partial [Candidatus Marithrix sp.]|nr:hypothetical protein [Candidatus Marithrix sp.]